MRNVHRKPNPRSKLQVLPEERQDEILEFCLRHTFLETVQWLSASGIQTNTGSLSRWRDWYLLRKELESADASVQDVLEEGKAAGWLKTDKEVQAFGQMFFNRMALNQRNPRIWSLMQQINLKQRDQKLKERQIALQARRIAALEEKIADAKAKIEEAMTAGQKTGGVSKETLARVAEELKLL